MDESKCLRQKTVLVVDDDELQLRAACLPLRQKGYNVVALGSGEDAIDWLFDTAHIPDLVILDAMMPGVSGFDVCRALRASAATSAVPVIFLTARRTQADMAEASNAGSDLYLTKPVIPSRLVNMAEIFLSADIRLIRRSAAPAEPAHAESR